MASRGEAKSVASRQRLEFRPTEDRFCQPGGGHQRACDPRMPHWSSSDRGVNPDGARRGPPRGHPAREHQRFTGSVTTNATASANARLPQSSRRAGRPPSSRDHEQDQVVDDLHQRIRDRVGGERGPDGVAERHAAGGLRSASSARSRTIRRDDREQDRRQVVPTERRRDHHPEDLADRQAMDGRLERAAIERRRGGARVTSGGGRARPRTAPTSG